MAAHHVGELHRIECFSYYSRSTERFKMFKFLYLRTGRHEDNRGFRRAYVFAQTREYGRSIHARHHDIAKDQVGRSIGRYSKGIVSTGATHHCKSMIETK